MTESSDAARARSRQLADAALALFDEGKAADALERWQEALQLDSTNIRAVTGLGMCAVAAGRADKAVPLFVRALELDGLDATHHLNLGQALLATGDAHRAMQSLLSARDLAPDEPAPHLAIARALAASGHIREAANALEWTLARFPSDTHPQTRGLARHLGDMLHDLEEAEAAKGAYLRALQEDPDDADALCHLAILAWEGGDDGNARALVAQALARAPDHEDARQLVARLGPA